MIGGYAVWDTHIHIIPGVDDGARTTEEAIEMLRMEYRQGVDCVYATPHSLAFDHNAEFVQKKYEELKRAIEGARINIQLMGLGCEVFCHPGNITECIKKIKDGVYPTLSQYVLTELPTYGISINDVMICLDKIIDAGYVPVLSHVERYEFSDIKSIAFLRDKGVQIQVNAYSLTNGASSAKRKLTTELVKYGMVDFVGSDAHRLDHRPPVVEEGVKRIIELTSDVDAMLILAANPKQRLLRGE
ncbi:tyrosine-protein phosphatase [Butyrivibrio sp. AE3004]|uniref:tyrosine-protein phosphatase n=1 Tax=Butyrivibrio sp. AE3004 TaxID=1506994 RepID=UPI000494359E|nr:CpsB/CapC family capsule biosynthesis tyrosine phosphatase [Butyrivibrio sp. AE3004]